MSSAAVVTGTFKVNTSWNDKKSIYSLPAKYQYKKLLWNVSLSEINVWKNPLINIDKQIVNKYWIVILFVLLGHQINVFYWQHFTIIGNIKILINTNTNNM